MSVPILWSLFCAGYIIGSAGGAYIGSRIDVWINPYAGQLNPVEDAKMIRE